METSISLNVLEWRVRIGAGHCIVLSSSVCLHLFFRLLSPWDVCVVFQPFFPRQAFCLITLAPVPTQLSLCLRRDSWWPNSWSGSKIGSSKFEAMPTGSPVFMTVIVLSCLLLPVVEQGKLLHSSPTHTHTHTHTHTITHTQCKLDFQRSAFSQSGWSGRGWCQQCRDK